MHRKRNEFLNILKVQHFKYTIPKFKPCMKKNWWFYTRLKAARFCSQEWSSTCAAKMSCHMTWWRCVVDRTTRLQYDMACSGYTQHQYPHRRFKIQRKHSIQNLLTCCFASETLLSDQLCPQHHVTTWICAINSSQSPDHVLAKIEHLSALRSQLNFYFRVL